MAAAMRLHDYGNENLLKTVFINILLFAVIAMGLYFMSNYVLMYYGWKPQPIVEYQQMPYLASMKLGVWISVALILGCLAVKAETAGKTRMFLLCLGAAVVFLGMFCYGLYTAHG